MQEQQAIEAVGQYAYDRHSDLTRSNIMGFDEEDLARIRTERGYLVFTVENVHVDETEVEDGQTIWYIAATIQFQTEEAPIEGSTDIYECYMGTDGKWCIDWHHS